MTQFEQKALFGGAITGVAPQGWIDGSTVREIPDHQELFLSSINLSNLIFEINEYIPKGQVIRTLSAAPEIAPPTGFHADADAEGIAAAMYHLRDLCDEEDIIDVINPPRRVQLKQLISAKDLSAFAGLVKFTTPRKQRTNSVQQRQDVSHVSVDASGGTSADFGSTTASGSASSPSLRPDRSIQSCHFLLVRLPEKETDLLVFVNVPHDEFDLQGDPRALAKEEALASDLIGKFVEVLDVKDWSLFG